MTTFRKSAAALLASAALAGCTMIPTYERPVAPVPEAFPYPSATEGTPAATIE